MGDTYTFPKFYLNIGIAKQIPAIQGFKINYILIEECNVDSLFCATEGTGFVIDNISRHNISRLLIRWVTVYYKQG